MNSLTVVYITARRNNHAEWFIDSLASQLANRDKVDVIVVDLYGTVVPPPVWRWGRFIHTEPKPNIWQGRHRITKEDWWAAANARNTGICLCQSEWIAFIDDRSVLLPGWIDGVKRAMAGQYACAGSYEKALDVEVKDGVLTRYIPNPNGKDPRLAKMPFFSPCKGWFWFGCNGVLPLEWCLAVNGFDETCDSLGLEDNMFGMMLMNRGVKMCFDPQMRILEDRTPENTESSPRRMDKGTPPKDKSHALRERLVFKTFATHPWNLRQVRNNVLAGHQFPSPAGISPTHDWWDGQQISTF